MPGSLSEREPCTSRVGCLRASRCLLQGTICQKNIRWCGSRRVDGRTVGLISRRVRVSVLARLVVCSSDPPLQSRVLRVAANPSASPQSMATPAQMRKAPLRLGPGYQQIALLSRGRRALLQLVIEHDVIAPSSRREAETGALGEQRSLMQPRRGRAARLREDPRAATPVCHKRGAVCPKEASWQLVVRGVILRPSCHLTRTSCCRRRTIVSQLAAFGRASYDAMHAWATAGIRRQRVRTRWRPSKRVTSRKAGSHLGYSGTRRARYGASRTVRSLRVAWMWILGRRAWPRHRQHEYRSRREGGFPRRWFCTSTNIPPMPASFWWRSGLQRRPEPKRRRRRHTAREGYFDFAPRESIQ